MLRLLVDHAKRVDPADAFDHVVHPRALLRQKPGDAGARLHAEDVDVAVGDVVVAADDEGVALALHLGQVRDEAVEEILLDGLACRTAGARRHVQRRDRQAALEVHPDEATFGVHILHAQPAGDGGRRAFGVDRDPGVAFLLRVDEGVGEAWEVERLGRELVLLRLGLLEAHDVGVLRVHPRKEALARRGPDPVEIAGDDTEHELED